MDENLSTVLHSKGDLRMECRPIPEPGIGEVQLSMQDVGICGSDVHYWTHGCIGDFILTSPMVLGHEASGVVTKLGEGVTSLSVGDRVAVEPGVPCRLCNYCKEGHYNLCRKMRFCATPPVHGTLARFYCHAADFCYKLPDNVSTEDGALLEPLSVGVHACRRAGVSINSTVLISGAGPIGLCCFLTAKAMGAAKVCMTDVDSQRLEFAKKIGADHVLSVRAGTSKELASQIENLLGKSPDISLECSGNPAGLKTSILATASGGCVVMVGMQPDEVTVPLLNAAVREVDIRGIFRYANCYPIALSMIASGQVNVKPLITHRYKLEESQKAFEHARTMKDGAVKIMIKCG
ncbi:sorbitol dehydrogenase [Octopus bimaculoides]|uniref:Sorbitol dehydrogenase n=1 Tax=Octopus bimaculoides TaxID=37653 RepID=A0A0L8G9D6_OCTBM|nr:sorbitol dehydrogenase [Octopus bimaculoides]|eukprot:XP_014782983.1 PREDICTED: sorbitol dehydrogenase-like [Octopus bimaculoides]